MAGLLVAMAVMAILMSAALPTWRQAAQREREEELIFRGEQYARAIELYQRRYANAFPQNFDLLVEQRFLRKKYKDPMVEDGEFQLLYQIDMQRADGRLGAGAGARNVASGQARGGDASRAGASSFASDVTGGPTGTSGPRGGRGGQTDPGGFGGMGGGRGFGGRGGEGGRGFPGGRGGEGMPPDMGPGGPQRGPGGAFPPGGGIPGPPRGGGRG